MGKSIIFKSGRVTSNITHHYPEKSLTLEISSYLHVGDFHYYQYDYEHGYFSPTLQKWFFIDPESFVKIKKHQHQDLLLLWDTL